MTALHDEILSQLRDVPVLIDSLDDARDHAFHPRDRLPTGEEPFQIATS